MHTRKWKNETRHDPWVNSIHAHLAHGRSAMQGVQTPQKLNNHFFTQNLVASTGYELNSSSQCRLYTANEPHSALINRLKADQWVLPGLPLRPLQRLHRTQRCLQRWWCGCGSCERRSRRGWSCTADIEETTWTTSVRTWSRSSWSKDVCATYST